jgi:hypothetical protein
MHLAHQITLAGQYWPSLIWKNEKRKKAHEKRELVSFQAQIAQNYTKYLYRYCLHVAIFAEKPLQRRWATLFGASQKKKRKDETR